jgi:hypothetical protein
LFWNKQKNQQKMDSIQSAGDRCQVCNDANTLQSDPAHLAQRDAENQQSLQKHFLNIITNWCNETNTQTPLAAVGHISLDINMLISSTVLDSWEASLIAKGYIVTRNGPEFKIQVQ